MNEDYTIEQLEKTFKEHSEKFIKRELEAKERDTVGYKEYYTDGTFLNLSEALHVICREINLLKYKISLFEEVTETSISVEEMDKMINDISGVSKDLLGNNPID